MKLYGNLCLSRTTGPTGRAVLLVSRNVGPRGRRRGHVSLHVERVRYTDAKRALVADLKAIRADIDLALQDLER